MTSSQPSENGKEHREVSEETKASDMSWWQSLKIVTSNRNFTIYLITVWIYSSMSVLYRYFNLYFRDIGIPYVMIGFLFSVLLGIRLLGNFVSGYFADNYDRRKLAVVTMALSSLGYLLLSFAGDYITILGSMTIIGASSFTGTAGRAYYMEHIDRRFGGVAQSLFTLGTALGLVPLYVVSLLFNQGWEFIPVMKILLFIAGLLYAVCAFIRATALESTATPEREQKSENLMKDFLSENWRGLKLLARVFPVFLAVLMFDALSDSLYRFAELYYVNETLQFGIGDINLILLLTLLISVPLTLLLGRVFDKQGGHKLTVAIYSVMPLAIGLLIIAQFVPYVAPVSWQNAVDAIYPGLRVIFSLAFIATATKSINDVLWRSLINTYIQKSLPRQDLGKMISLSTTFTMLLLAIGPSIAGIIYDLFKGVPLLLAALFINITILAVLATRSMEPKASIEELEAEAENGKLSPDMLE